MPVTAVTHAAGSTQRERGELPQQPSGALRGITASPQPGAARTEHQSHAGHSLAQITLSSWPQPLGFPRPWQLLLCSSCAAQRTHRRCSNLSQSTASWECNACAGEGTGKRQTDMCCWAGARQGLAAAAQSGLAQIPLALDKWEPVPPRGCNSILLTFLPPLTASGSNSDLPGYSTISQQEMEPSQGSATPERSSSSTTSQAPLGPADCSRVPESGGLSRQRRTDRRRIRPRLHRDENGFNEPQEHRGSSHNAAPIAGSSALNSASQGTSESSRNSPAVGYNLRCRQGQRAQTRSRSPLQRRAPDSPSQPRRRQTRGSRQAPTQSAESGTNRCTRRGAPRSSRASTAADGSRSRQLGRARTRSRSPLEHRAAETRSQPRRCCRSCSRRQGPAQGRSRSRVPAQGRSRSRVPRWAPNINSQPQ
ncbi:serine/arginine repetitive matrix protein 2-like [Lagopus muta]|uniref:serine/arginine repetitive matrix protein 2-like n=1 Tax=Lagopus muta TaxID=64668 RepID=UPI00209FD91F|nr:serine/arginine repetitive matrix protein 2-like [Lagopus muta]XP_048812962.1 serine/arginine repetitive matrix protein 2-like [Lagopus muta]XP_048812963.1 serine/arginine repetitive matrix protein 2-like [Lagopus muta]XP_048812965.1 serine/arginine repetitive matrix protein 2-like [Lagopus muta]